MGVRTVIITSSAIDMVPPSNASASESTKGQEHQGSKMITLIASTNASITNNSTPSQGTADRIVESTVFRVDMPRIDDHFTGTGDLIAALMLAW
jgi:hypothetical protein